MSFLFLLGLKVPEKKSVHERQRKTVLRGEEMTLWVGGVRGRGQGQGGGWGRDKDAQKKKNKRTTVHMNIGH